MASSPTRAQTCVPCTGRQILYHWTTRESPWDYCYGVIDTIELNNKLNPPSSIHSFSKCLSTSYNVLGTALGAGGRWECTVAMILAFTELSFWEKQQKINRISKPIMWYIFKLSGLWERGEAEHGAEVCWVHLWVAGEGQCWENALWTKTGRRWGEFQVERVDWAKTPMCDHILLLKGWQGGRCAYSGICEEVGRRASGQVVAGPGWGSDPPEALGLLFHMMGAIKGPLGEEMAPHSNIFAWRIPWTEEPGGLQSIGSPRVRHDWSDLAWRILSRWVVWSVLCL